jgi:hypothetical protein
VGTWHVQQHGPDGALEPFRAGILRLNQAHGTPESPTRGYHETITRGYLTLIARRLAAATAARTLEARVEAVLVSPLADRDVLLRYYTRERLLSPEARAGYCPPDLRALDADPRAPI